MSRKSRSDKIRADGICFICKCKMDDNDPKLAHSECYMLRNRGKTRKQIREIIASGNYRIN